MFYILFLTIFLYYILHVLYFILSLLNPLHIQKSYSSKISKNSNHYNPKNFSKCVSNRIFINLGLSHLHVNN